MPAAPHAPAAVLVVSHATLLIVFLQELLGKDVLLSHPDACLDRKNGTEIAIPNTSVTILDVYVDAEKLVRWDESSGDGAAKNAMIPGITGVDIVSLTSTKHLDSVS